MGRDKARLPLSGRTLLARVRGAARPLGFPVRVLRKDIVPRCGPLGGIYSALATTKSSAVLFLACDMPFVSTAVLRSLLAKFDGERAVFAVCGRVPGFPTVLPKSALPIVEEVVSRGDLSLKKLARTLKAQLAPVPGQLAFNINTPEELAVAKRRVRSAQEQLVKRR